jgi:hypothetical protein
MEMSKILSESPNCMTRWNDGVKVNHFDSLQDASQSSSIMIHKCHEIKWFPENHEDLIHSENQLECDLEVIETD